MLNIGTDYQRGRWSAAWGSECKTHGTLDLSIMQYNDIKKKHTHAPAINIKAVNSFTLAAQYVSALFDFFLNKSCSCLFLKIWKKRVWENQIFLSARGWCTFSCSFSSSSVTFQRLNAFLSGVCRRTLFTVNCGDRFPLAPGDDFLQHENIEVKTSSNQAACLEPEW